jgi:ribosomal protein S18 acetylase RimI-like enzyme
MVDLKKIELRPATDDDRQFIWDLHQSTIGKYLIEAFGWNESEQREVFEQRLMLPSNRIVMLSEQRIGVVAILKGPLADVVTRIAILPELQNQGIGSYLMRSIQEQSARDGRFVRLSVLKCNPARNLYERLGFRTVRETDQECHMVWSERSQGGRQE